jgi:hypothetical protein
MFTARWGGVGEKRLRLWVVCKPFLPYIELVTLTRRAAAKCQTADYRLRN